MSQSSSCRSSTSVEEKHALETKQFLSCLVFFVDRNQLHTFFNFLAVRIAVSLFGMLMSLKKHPQCSLECCFAMVMLVNDATGEARGLGEESNKAACGDFKASGVARAVENVMSIEMDADGQPDEEEKIEKETDVKESTLFPVLKS